MTQHVTKADLTTPVGEANPKTGDRVTPASLLARLGGWVERHPYLYVLIFQAITSAGVVLLTLSAPDIPVAQSPEEGFDPSLPWQSNFRFRIAAMAIAACPLALIIPFVARTPSPGRIAALMVSAAIALTAVISTFSVPSKEDHDSVFADWAQERYGIALTTDQVRDMRSGAILMIDKQAITISEADDGRLYLMGEVITNGKEGE